MNESEDGTQVGEDDVTLPRVTFSTATAVAMAPVHLASLAWVIFFFNLVQKMVDTSHPVYGLILHNFGLMLFANIVCVITYLPFVMFGYFDFWMEFSIRMMIACIHFHQVTWLALTALRLYFLFYASDDIDPKSLCRPMQACVWFSFVMLSVIFWVLMQLSLGSFGVDISTFYFQIPDVLTRYLLGVLAVVITNVTDVISVTLYFYIYVRSKKQTEEEDSNGQGDGPFGGIYVGPPIPPLANDQDNNGLQLPGMVEYDFNSAHNYEDLDNPPFPIGHLPPPQLVTPPNSPSSTSLPPAPIASDSHSEQAKCAMRAMRIHAWTCLLDIAIFPVPQAMSFWSGSPLASYMTVYVWAYFLQVVVSVQNFGKLRTVLKDFLSILSSQSN